MAFLKNGNHTAVTEFILFGLTDNPILRVVLFIIILCIYLLTVFGNLSTILLIRVSSQLHHPMYFFLSHVAFADLGYSSSVIPNMLLHSWWREAQFLTLDVASSLVQLLSLADWNASFWLPWLMILLLVAYIGGFLDSCSFTVSFYSLVFCGPNEVNHFFCDLAPLLKLSCSNVSVTAVVLSFTVGFVIVVTVLVIAISYTYNLIAILKITLFYGTITFIYVMPKSSYSTDQNKVLSVFYMVVIPMLNPIIYSFRNNEIKGALKRQLVRKIFS
uniref:G-protein coupled receptors family 1 profile domain-containing protein n=1 Tax=Cricetulus griseus TaxID=10029 RepID=A0A8C2LGK2_CRIGR